MFLMIIEMIFKKTNMAFSSDIWVSVIMHIRCTKTLLRLRSVCKAIKEQIPRHLITGIPTELERLLLFNPHSTIYSKIHISEHEDIEGALADDGRQFWAWVYSDPIRLIQYDVTRNDARVSRFDMTSDPNSFLWIKVATNGLICMLTASEDEGPIFLSAFLQNPGQRMELLMETEIERKRVMSLSVFNDEYMFSRNSIQCFCWNERTFIVMIPLDTEGQISLMEVGGSAEHKWVSWQIPCEKSKRIGCIRQVKHLIYIMPSRGCSVFAINLLASNPCPVFLHSLPKIPSSANRLGRNAVLKQQGIASMMDVSEDGENFIVHVQNMKCVFHLTKSTIRLLVDRSIEINSVAFIGNNAVVCFVKASTEYRLYNLKTRDFVRSFHFDFVPHFSLMGAKCIWSIGPSMSVHRQIASD
jgi:hypothetical protein